ncbi:MAG TPA: SRPBCC family protein [Gemmatimonadales bacterium]|nr:SRPBCC family protein [Gemmatimonadales bacterium]
MGVQSGWSLFLVVGLSACDYVPWDRFADRSDPVGTARGFLAAVKRGDCKKSWTYFSSETQEKIREQSKREIRHAPYYSEIFAPERLHCTPYDDYRPSTVQLASSDGRRAAVNVIERVPDPKSFALPGWPPIGRMDARRTMELTRGEQGWNVLPRVPEDPRAKYGEKTYDIGRAVVVTKPGKVVDGMTMFGVEGTMNVEIDPADFERVLADPEQWPTFWPQLTSVRWLGPTDSYGYRPLSVMFALPAGAREARIFFRQAGRTAEHRSFSFGFASEYSYWGNKASNARESGRIRWAGTFSATPDNSLKGGSRLRWGHTISEAGLADPNTVAGQLDAFYREAKSRKDAAR